MGRIYFGDLNIVKTWNQYRRHDLPVRIIRILINPGSLDPAVQQFAQRTVPAVRRFQIDSFRAKSQLDVHRVIYLPDPRNHAFNLRPLQFQTAGGELARYQLTRYR